MLHIRPGSRHRTMEVEVRNVSRLAPKETLRKLFTMIGSLLYFEHRPDTGGSYFCRLVYGNIIDGFRAVRLTGTELGDRRFNVIPISLLSSSLESSANFSFMDDKSFDSTYRMATGPEVKANLCTAIVWRGDSTTKDPEAKLESPTAKELDNSKRILSQFDVEELKSMCGGEDVVHCVYPLTHRGLRLVLVQFIDRSSMKLAFDRLRVARCSDGSRALIDDAWRRFESRWLMNALEAVLISEKRIKTQSSNRDSDTRSGSKSSSDRYSKIESSSISRSGSSSDHRYLNSDSRLKNESKISTESKPGGDSKSRDKSLEVERDFSVRSSDRDRSPSETRYARR